MPSPYRLAGLWAIAADAVAIVVFATVGLLSHDKGLGPAGYARDVLTIGGGWLLVARATGLYAAPTMRRYLTTWFLGVTAGVAVRAIALGRNFDGKELSFLIVALITTLVFTTLARAIANTLAERRATA